MRDKPRLVERQRVDTGIAPAHPPLNWEKSRFRRHTELVFALGDYMAQINSSLKLYHRNYRPIRHFFIAGDVSQEHKIEPETRVKKSCHEIRIKKDSRRQRVLFWGSCCTRNPCCAHQTGTQTRESHAFHADRDM